MGILAKISQILANNEISIFAVSIFDTDYIMVKADKFERATELLAANGYEIVENNVIM